jgi:hypothetical protein
MRSRNYLIQKDILGGKMKLITIILTILLLVSCSNDSSSNVADSTSKIDNGISGKEYFRGIVLGYGEIAEQIPEINDYLKVSLYVTDLKDYESITSFNDKIIDRMEKVNPSFFAQFKKDMESGNHISVQNAIKDAADFFSGIRSNLSDTGEKYKVPPIIGVIQLLFPPPPIQFFIFQFNVFNDAPSTFFTKLSDVKFKNLLKDQIINSITEQF